MADDGKIIAGVSGLAGRYATALFELARDAGELDTIAGDLATLKSLINDSQDLRRLVRSPVFSREEQGKAMAAILEKADAAKLTQRFIGLVATKRRLFALPGMIDAYMSLLAQHRGEVTAQVVSAHTLDEGQMTALADALKNAAGRDVQIETRVDNEILGGLIVRMGSRMIDSSLRTKLTNLQVAMKEVG